jgi:bifunctional non-homologous end joining protein LigD
MLADRIPFRVAPMLATLVREPFHKSGWTYEAKYDGYRILAYKEGRKVTLLSRNAKDRTATFESIAQAVAELGPRSLLLDGEAVTFDRNGVSRFQLLQNLESSPGYAVFDCLYRDGTDLRQNPLSSRRAALEQIIRTGDPKQTLFTSAILSNDGFKAFELAKRGGLEGLVAKNQSAHYVQGRSKEWLKVKVHQEDEFIIVGYTAPRGSRKYFGALLLGAYDRGKLRYVGKVGTGFDQERLSQLYGAFRPLKRESPALAEPPREKDVVYLAPRLVAQIAFEERTADGKLRQPVFLGLRDDKKPEDVKMPFPT